MTRLPVAAFVALAIATIAAFFVTQHLKVSTPLLTGFPAPHPAAINPVDGRVCRERSHDGTVKRASHRSMFVSFYLQNRTDDVDVYIVASDQTTIVRQIGFGVHMQGGAHAVRRTFTWDGRLPNGSPAPDGTYYIRVTLVHQGRSVLISNNAGPEAVTVETVPPQPRVTAVTPKLIPQPAVAVASIHYTGNRGLGGRVLIYRTDLPGPPRLVKSFASGRGSATKWDGTLPGGRQAPPGTYLVGFKLTDRACNTGTFPPRLPPVPGTAPHAGVTVRYLAAEPPLTPVPAGSRATVYVDALRHTYHWALRRAGAQKVLASGATSNFQLRVPIPGGGAGLYELALRYGVHRTVVPLVADSAGAQRSGRALVVLPALTWQGRNPVDDTGDGFPSTLAAGDAVELARPLVDGLPAGFADETALSSHLHSTGRAFDLTTDLALAEGVGPSLHDARAVVLAGDERWLPTGLAVALRSYVAGGGRVLSLGIDSLRRVVRLSSGRALAPGAVSLTDVLGARPGRLSAGRGALILAGRDGLHIFRGTAGVLRGYRRYQQFAPAAVSGPFASVAGVSTVTPSIIGYRLGRGLVIDIGLPGFASSLAHNFDARELLGRIWTVLVS